ncbi:MAG TPA: response regulator transcription factor [Stellaceae bacterium]
MAKILIVDDDPAIREVVGFALGRAGFETVEASDGKAALERFAAAKPDLVVLDVLMPGLDGIEVCRELRRRGSVPILFLSSKDDEVDRIVGLEIGGDDYLVKPFSPRELVARVKALLRRAAAPEPPAGAATVLRHGRLSLDLEQVRAAWDGQEVALTATEFGILRTLMSRPGKVYTRDNLMDGAYGIDKVVSDRTIDSHVRRLRAKFAAIGAEPIETLHGFGYKLAACA